MSIVAAERLVWALDWQGVLYKIEPQQGTIERCETPKRVLSVSASGTRCVALLCDLTIYDVEDTENVPDWNSFPRGIMQVACGRSVDYALSIDGILYYRGDACGIPQGLVKGPTEVNHVYAGGQHALALINA